MDSYNVTFTFCLLWTSHCVTVYIQWVYNTHINMKPVKYIMSSDECE